MTGNALSLIRSALQDDTQHNQTHKQTLGVFAEVRGNRCSHRINTNGLQTASKIISVLFSDSTGSTRHQNLVINQLLAGSGL